MLTLGQLWKIVLENSHSSHHVVGLMISSPIMVMTNRHLRSELLLIEAGKPRPHPQIAPRLLGEPLYPVYTQQSFSVRVRVQGSSQDN